MNRRPLSDAQISQALRAHLPERAQAGLRERILDTVESTRQQRPVPAFVSRLADADPVARRRALLLAAALLVALTLAVAAGVGAWLDWQTRDLDTFSLDPPTDVDAYVLGAYEGLADLPALNITIIEVEGTKARYSYDGVGIVRHDHYSSPDDAEPSEYRILSEDRLAMRADLDGQPVWVAYDQQGNPLSEVGLATGFNTFCESPWEYVALEHLIGRPTHHVACGASEMWIDVETGIPLRSIRAQPIDVGPTTTFEVIELEIGPQPADLFLPPPGLTAMGDAEYECAVDPGCESPAPAAPPPPEAPVSTPPPAPGNYAAPPDLEAFIAEVLAKSPVPPALEMWVDRVGGPEATRTRYLFDGSGRYRAEVSRAPRKSRTVYLDTGGHYYDSDGLTDDGRTIWTDRGALGPELRPPDFGIGERCLRDWEHRGFDLVNARPAHHLACGDAEYWIDREWLLVVRSRMKPDPLGDDATVYAVTDVQFVQPPAELFELPEDAVVCAMVSSGRCVDESGNPQDLPSARPAPGPSG